MIRPNWFFDPRPHRWTGKLGSGNDEWFFFPIRVALLAAIVLGLLGGLR